jgi:hypothetical protein
VVEVRKTAEKANSYRDRIIMNVISRTNRTTLRAAMKKWLSVVEERELHREMIRRNLRSKRVAMNFFMTWYWDAFDGDLQDQIEDMFGATRTFMNAAFDDEGIPSNALDFGAYYDDEGKGSDSPPPPTWGERSASDEFHTPGKASRSVEGSFHQSPSRDDAADNDVDIDAYDRYE